MPQGYIESSGVYLYILASVYLQYWMMAFCISRVKNSFFYSFLSIYLARCMVMQFAWLVTVGAVGLVVEYRTCNWEVAGSTHIRSTASNFEQVANLLCPQANSASYPQWDGKWVVATATGWRPSVADWGDDVFASCTVCPTVHYHGQWMASCHIMRCGTTGSFQSAATSVIVKHCWLRRVQLV